MANEVEKTEQLSDRQRSQLLGVADWVGRSERAGSRLHGENHWRSVAAIGARLAGLTDGADLYVALLFGLLHDSCRLNEGYDEDHGFRAAVLMDHLYAGGRVDLSEDHLTRLRDGLVRHDNGDVTDDPLIGVCWDADRLCLPRVGIVIDPDLLSTAAAKADRAWSVSLVNRPPEWAEIFGSEH